MQNIPWSFLLKKIGIVYLSFLVLSIVFVVSLRFHSRLNYSNEKLEKAISTESNFRDKTNDPCKYSILGDPIADGVVYAKLELFCPDGRRSSNTLDLRAVKGDTVIDLINELARVSGFEVKIDNKSVALGSLKDGDGDDVWKCYSDMNKITSLNMKLRTFGSYKCFYGYNNIQILPLIK